MCTSPLIRYRSKRGVCKDSLFYSTSFSIKSLKEIQSCFGSYSNFKSYFDRNFDYQFIKCRHCIECKTEYSREWSIRCAHEYQMSKKACFVTFTIDDKKAEDFFKEKSMRSYCKKCDKGNRYIRYPINYTLSKGFILDSIKKIRDNLFKRYGISIRYFGCGEYGEQNERPHYHVIIFGYDFPDKVFIENSSKGVPLFHSEELQSMYDYGLVKIQEVNHRACSYVAKYCTKKMRFTNELSEQEVYSGSRP